MRLSLLMVALGLAGGIAIGVAGTSIARAQSSDTFTLEQHDQIIVEQQGCYAECRVLGMRRLCTLKNAGCKTVCRTLPECSINGKAMQVCAVIKAER